MPDSQPTDLDSETNPDPADAMAAALHQRLIHNAEFLDAVKEYRETNPSPMGIYEGLVRQIRDDTARVKRVLNSPRTDVQLPDDEHPDVSRTIPTPFDDSDSDTTNDPFRP